MYVSVYKMNSGDLYVKFINFQLISFNSLLQYMFFSGSLELNKQYKKIWYVPNEFHFRFKEAEVSLVLDV